MDKLLREDHLDVINNVVKTGKWKKRRKSIYHIVSKEGVVIVIKELPDRFKVITIGGNYEKIYKM